MVYKVNLNCCIRKVYKYVFTCLYININYKKAYWKKEIEEKFKKIKEEDEEYLYEEENK